MPTPSAPIKTPLGQDELRHRTRGLGQRHRTVLLLVDGQRSLGDILTMAHKAGAQTSHFEELLQLGLIELPHPAIPPEAAETAPGALDIPKVTAVVLDVPPDAPADEHQAEAAPEEEPQFAPAEDNATESPPIEPSGPPLEPALAEMPRDEPFALPVVTVAPAPALALAAPVFPHEEPVPRKRRRSTVTAPPTAAQPEQEVPTLSQADGGDWLTVRDHPTEMKAECDEGTEPAENLEDVRGLLIQCLGGDAALFAPLVLNRVRTARTTGDLISLVWEIDRHRSRIRRKHSQLLSLERARELLGMGNTVVGGDSKIDGESWHDTDPDG